LVPVVGNVSFSLTHSLLGLFFIQTQTEVKAVSKSKSKAIPVTGHEGL
jgi:hypothetical protein